MAEEHKCLHEIDLAVLSVHQESVTQDIAEIKDDMKKILACIQGNGKKGILTRLALLEQIKSMSPRKTAIVGTGSAASLVAIFEFIKWFIIYARG